MSPPYYLRQNNPIPPETTVSCANLHAQTHTRTHKHTHKHDCRGFGIVQLMFILARTWLLNTVNIFSIMLDLEIWEGLFKSLLYQFYNQFYCVSGIIVLLEHSGYAEEFWGNPRFSLFHQLCVQCTSSTGSKTASHHDAATTMLNRKYSVLWGWIPYLYFSKHTSVNCG